MSTSTERNYIKAIQENDLRKAETIVKTAQEAQETLDFTSFSGSFAISSLMFSKIRSHIRDNNIDIIDHFLNHVQTEAISNELVGLCATAVEHERYDLAERIMAKGNFKGRDFSRLTTPFIDKHDKRAAQPLLRKIKEQAPEFEKDLLNARFANACRNHDTRTAKKLHEEGAELSFNSSIRSTLKQSLRNPEKSQEVTTTYMIHAFDEAQYYAHKLINAAIRGENTNALSEMLKADWHFDHDLLLKSFTTGMKKNDRALGAFIIEYAERDDCLTTGLVNNFYVQAHCHDQPLFIQNHDAIFAEAKENKSLKIDIISHHIKTKPAFNLRASLTQKDGTVMQISKGDPISLLQKRISIEINPDNIHFLLDTQNYKGHYYCSSREIKRLLETIASNSHIKAEEKKNIAEKIYTTLSGHTRGANIAEVYTNYIIDGIKKLNNEGQASFALAAIPQLDESTWHANAIDRLFTKRDIANRATDNELYQIIDKTAHMSHRTIAAFLPYLVKENRSKAANYALDKHAEHLTQEDLREIQLENMFGGKSKQIDQKIDSILTERMLSDEEILNAKHRAAADYIESNARSITSSDIATLALNFGITNSLPALTSKNSYRNLVEHLIGRKNYDAAGYLVKNGVSFPISCLNHFMEETPGSGKDDGHLHCFKMLCQKAPPLENSRRTKELIRWASNRRNAKSVYIEALVDINILEHIHDKSALRDFEENMLHALEKENLGPHERMNNKLCKAFRKRHDYIEQKEAIDYSHHTLHEYTGNGPSNCDHETVKQQMSRQFAILSGAERPMVTEDMRFRPRPQKTAEQDNKDTKKKNNRSDFIHSLLRRPRR